MEEGGVFIITTGKSSGRPKWKWEDNIRINRKEIGINTRHLVDSGQDRDCSRRVVNATLNVRVP